MKKICTEYILGFLLLFLFSFSETKAQTIPEIAANNRSFSQIFDSLSTGLIPARIPYGILMDRVYGWAGLEEWNNGDTSTGASVPPKWIT